MILQENAEAPVTASRFAVEIDQPRNLLVIRYHGRVETADIEQCATEVRSALWKLQPNFRLLVDLTGLEMMGVSCAPALEKIMELCNDAGVSCVVRAIPDPRCDIGLQIMSRFHYSPDVRTVTCESVDEAKRVLAD